MTRLLSELAEIIVLQKGTHKTPQDGVCINELTAWINGEKHSDDPECASRVVSRFLMGLNDAVSDDVRQRLAPYALRQIGTRGTPAQEQQRAFMCADWAVRVCAPMALRAAGCDADAERLALLPPVVDQESARAAAYAAYAANVDAAGVAGAAAYAAYAANVDAAGVAYATYAARSVAYAAACASAWDSALDLVDRLIAVTGSQITDEVVERATLLRDRIAVLPT